MVVMANRSRPSSHRAMVTQALSASWRVWPHTYAATASNGRWRPYRHLNHMAVTIADAIRAGGGRVIVNVPTRYGKSELVCHWLPTWYLDAYPHKRIILVSYAAEVAADWGRRVRDEFAQNPSCLTKLREDTTAAHRWYTPEGGGMVTAGIGGPITGRGGDLIVIDDPTKNMQDAYSPLIRRRIIEWFQSTLYTRAEPGATIVVVMSRWHEDDLSGHLIDRHADDWQVIRMPAVAESDDPLGRPEGAALWPERYDEVALTQIRLAVGRNTWESLYQQHPTAAGAGRAYCNFRSDVHVNGLDRLRSDLPIHLSVDFNAMPHMHCLIGQYDQTADMFTVVHEIADPNIRTARAAGFAFVDLILDKYRDWRWPELHLFGDATGQYCGRNVSTGTSEWESLEAAIRSRLPDVVIRRRLPRANPPIVDRVTAFNEALLDVENRSHYQLSRQCRTLRQDFLDQRLGEDGVLDETNRLLGHAAAAEGYRVHYLRPSGQVPIDFTAGAFLV